MRTSASRRAYDLSIRTLLMLTLTMLTGFSLARMGSNPTSPPTSPPQAQPFGYVAPVALSSPNVASGAAVLYQPWFDLTDYSGDLNAFAVNREGRLSANPAWQAGKIFDAQAQANPRFWDNDRIIIVGDTDGRGIPFRFQHLSAAQQALVRSEDVVNYVRGQRDFAANTSGCGPRGGNDEDDDKDHDEDDDGKRNGDDDSGDGNGEGRNTSGSGSSKQLESQKANDNPSARAQAVALNAKLSNEFGGQSNDDREKSSAKDLDDDKDNDRDDDEGDDDNDGPAKPCKPTARFLDRSLLGAFIHTRPVFVGPPREGYPFDNYTAVFARDFADRIPIVYAGANDGLLHAFNANTGEEVFAYVPSMVLGNLPDYAGTAPPPVSPPPRNDDKDQNEDDDKDDQSDKMPSERDSNADAAKLMSSTFISTTKTEDDDKNDDDDNKKKNRPPPAAPAEPTLVYSVDGPLTAGDVQIADQWRTVLAGGLGAGGRGYFALDITDPVQTTNTESDASRLLLWEFTPEDDADIGYSYSRVSIVRLNDPARTWAAVFGNGYFSAGGRAALYVVDIGTGRLIKKFIVATSGEPNGLSSPTLVDTNTDYAADYAYAGDLNGNVWKFDLTAPSPDQWRVDFEGQPLFTARTVRGEVQSITTAPTASFHPFRGLIITVATGRLLTDRDLKSEQESVYGLWDDGAPVSRDATLLTTSFTESIETQRRTAPIGFVDWSTAKGWRLDLPAGERVLTDPLVRAERVQFTSTDSGSGSNWLVELDTSTGAAPRFPVFGFDTTGIDPTAPRIVGVTQGKGLVSRPTFAILAAGADSFYINRIQAVDQSCVVKRPPRTKKDENTDDDQEDDDSDRDSKEHREINRIFSGSDKEGNDDGNDGEGDDDGSDKPDRRDDVCVTPPPPPRCVRNRERDDDNDGDADDDGTPRQPPSQPPGPQVGTEGGVNFGTQEGKNLPGRKLWREVVSPSGAVAAAR